MKNIQREIKRHPKIVALTSSWWASKGVTLLAYFAGALPVFPPSKRNSGDKEEKRWRKKKNRRNRKLPRWSGNKASRASRTAAQCNMASWQSANNTSGRMHTGAFRVWCRQGFLRLVKNVGNYFWKGNTNTCFSLDSNDTGVVVFFLYFRKYAHMVSYLRCSIALQIQFESSHSRFLRPPVSRCLRSRRGSPCKGLTFLNGLSDCW